MAPELLAKSLAVPDLSDPKNGINAINLVVERIIKSLSNSFGPLPIDVYRASPEVSVEENYDLLLFPADNAGRSSRYTRYVNDTTVLRTHTSAAIPAWLKRSGKNHDDQIVVAPGICYRRDVVDQTHCGEPHQMDVWRIRKGLPRLERPELIALIEVLINGVIPGYRYRANEVVHPYTINGLEVEILVGDTWMEILECGEAHPTILKNAGLDPAEYSGLAMGMGLDRLAMIIKGIDDIRVFRSTDPRITKQMTTLHKYVSVSNQPATKRVLSYSASVDKNEEDICEAIRDVLGANVIHLEEVKVEEFPYESLEPIARERLGIHPSQKNVVATLIFRSIEGSLPKKTVNEWMQNIYPRLNEGSKGYM